MRLPTLQGEAAADFEAIRRVVSASLCGRACQCQKDSRLADQLERGVTGQEEPLVLDEGRPPTELRPSTPALHAKAAVLGHNQEIIWPLCRLE